MIKLGLAARHGTPFDLNDEEEYRTPSAGFGIEARLYSEMPHLDFKPAPGLLTEVSFPSHDWLRVDTWVKTGTTVSPFFDPMIAKVIARGDTREEARSRLYDALCETSIKGPMNNLDYLCKVIDCPGAGRACSVPLCEQAWLTLSALLLH
jgi:urea carboxylase